MINWSGIPFNSHLGRLLRAALRLLPSKLVVPILQGRLRGKKWIVGSSDNGYWLGTYELSKQKRFTETIKSGTTVFDIGAHVGFYSLLSSELVGHNGNVIAFEPLPRNLDLLRRHFSLNRVTNVTVIDAAVSDRGGIADFEEGASAAQGRIGENGGLPVRTISIDEEVFGGRLPIPDFIKMDVEGGEYRALLGARRTLERYHPSIFLATHGELVHEQCCHLLESLDFCVEALDAPCIEGASEILAFSREVNS